MKKIAVWLSVIVSLFSMASIAAAASSDGGPDQVLSSNPGTQAQQQSREFGTSASSILQIGSAAFHDRTSTAGGLTYLSTGLVRGNVTGFNYWAPVNLPAGARVIFLDLYACDTNATNHVNAFFTGYSGSNTPVTNDIALVTSSQGGGSGCSYWITLLDHTINNNVRYDGGYHYAINLSFGTVDGTNSFKGVDLWWQRQVSPAPASASFSDVPTGHWAFQWIEALRASGITSGCAAGLYCPNNNVSRAEMAVFLSKALGLQWPN